MFTGLAVYAGIYVLTIYGYVRLFDIFGVGDMLVWISAIASAAYLALFSTYGSAIATGW